MMNANSWRGPQHQPIATPGSSPRYLFNPEQKPKPKKKIFVLKSEEENDGAGSRSRRPIDPKSPRSNR